MLLLIVALFFIILSNETVQTKLAQSLVNKLEKQTGSNIDIGRIKFSFFDKLTIEDIYIADNHNDTLLHVNKLCANIEGINLSSNNFRLKNIKLENPYLKIISYDDGSMNIFSFLESIEGKTDNEEQTTSSFFFSCAETSIKNGRFVYYDSERKDIPYGMNYDDMDFRSIDANIYDLRTVGDSIKMTIDSLKCLEKSGFSVRDVLSELTIASGLLRFDDVHIALPKSELNAEYLNFSYTPSTGAWSNFVRAVLQDYRLKKSKINLGEIAIFNDNLLGYNETLTVSGHIMGTVQNMRCEDMLVKAYKNTAFSGNISMNGLPNVDEAFFDATISHFQTTLDDLEKIKIPNYEEQYLSFPKTLKKIGTLKAIGKYTGFVSDFVFYGKLFSSYGNIKTDLSVKPTTKTKQLEVSGKIISNDFKIGDLLENEMIGNISLNVDVVNAMANDNYNSYAKVKGVINEVEIKEYPYKNIKIDGYFADKVFDGKLSVNNKNIAFDFQGNFDLHEEVPKTNFTFKLAHAKLAPLHLNILSKDSIPHISFNMESELDGGSIDNATGSVNIYDLKYSNSKGKVFADTLAIKSSLTEETRTLKVNSEFITAELKGNFKISELSTLPQRLISEHINVAQFRKTATSHNEQGELSVNFKNMNPLLDLFTEGYKVSKNSKLFANYKMGTPNSIRVNFNAGLLKIEDKIFRNVKLNSKGADKLTTKLTIDRIDFAENFNILKFSTINTLSDNMMETAITWGDKERLPYDGTISVNSMFKETANQQLSIKNIFSPSTFTIDKKTWKINNAEVIVDSTDITINKFKISNSNEYVELDGLWSSDKDDAINLRFNTFQVGHLCRALGVKSITLFGEMSGYAKYKNIKGTHTLESDLKIPELILENQHLGTLNIESDWEQSKKALNTKASLSYGSQQLFTVNGQYGLQHSSIDYKINFNKLNLDLVKGFAKEYITNLSGNIAGALTVTGTTKKPEINGSLALKIPTLALAETGVTYHLEEEIAVKNNLIKFDNFKLLDKKNKAATIDGKVLLGTGANSDIDLQIKANSLRILEDSYKPLAYGNARASADLNITGNFDKIKIRGNVVTDDNSKIIVPFDSASEVGDNDFITFINPADSAKYQEGNDIVFIPTGSKSPLSFNVDFKINPTSEIQVLFESKSGSTLKSKGTADLYISRDKTGKQNIVGRYTVDQGTFFYSLQSIVNKKFILQKGGTISWNGAPKEAYIDLNAVYQLKASVAPLLYQDGNSAKQRQTTVLCKAHITGQLEDPKLTFKIEFPNLDSTTEGNVKAALQTTDITKQILSLLVFNSFTIPEYNPNIVGKNNTDALSVTTSELLSSQVSNILSQLSDDVNIGFIYRPGDDLTQEELGLAISTELLKNRVVISGNLGFSSQDENSRFNDFVGDVDFDIKLNKKGNLRLRAFSHARDNLYYYENKKNIQGVGIIYNEEFDTFRELIQHYKEKLGWGRKKAKN